MTFEDIQLLDGQQLSVLENQVIYKGKGNFGVRGANQSGIVLTEQMLQRHILTIGSIGSGKTNLMYHMIKALRDNANEDDVFIFFDAKGDYYSKFYREGDMVIANDVEPPAGTVYWNIYDEIMMTPAEKREEFIREIATSLFKEDIEKSSAPIFAIGARDLFAAILTAQSKKIECDGETWNHEKFIEYLRTATDVTIRNLLLPYKELRWVRYYISKDNAKTSQSFMIHLYQTVYKVFSGAFSKEGSFSMRRAIQEKGKKAVFLEYDLSAGYLLESVYTLLIDTAMKEVLGRSRPGGRVFFILDEFPLVPKLSYMDNALNFGRSLGIRVIAGLQNVGQVEARYGDAMGSSLLSGFGTVFAFRLFDEESRRFIMNRHGMNKQVRHILSSNTEKGIQDIVMDGRVIEDWHIVQLNIGQCILSLPNGEPYIFYPIEYVD